MVRHLPFIEVLANASPEEWKVVKAGYLVLRTFDDWLRMGPVVMLNDARLNLIQADINAIPRKLDAHRRATRAIIKALLNADDTDVSAVAAVVASYAALLRTESRWPLAADVYTTVVNAIESTMAFRAVDKEFLAQLRLQQGGAARKSGDYDTATFAYQRAARIAKEANAVTIRLQAFIGLANVARALGNLSGADRLLSALLRIMDRWDGVPGYVRGDAFHARGSVRQGRERYATAMRDLFLAYQFTEDRYTRELILTDLGVCASDAGYRTIARDALTTIVERAQNIVAYTVAVVNLLELSVLAGDPNEFEQRRAQWVTVQKKSDPTTNAFAYLYVARGSARFFDRHEAMRAYEAALEYARTMRVYHAEFLLTDEYARLQRQEPAFTSPVAEIPVPKDLRDIAGAIAGIRNSALAPI